MTKRQFAIWLCLYILIAVALLFIGLTVYNARDVTRYTRLTDGKFALDCSKEPSSCEWIAPQLQQHATVSVCDDSLWQHIYNRERLHVQQACATVTGTTMDASHGKNKDGCRHEADGDGHCFLQLDSGQEKYINAMNTKNEGGNLVFEPVCRYRVTQTDAISECKNWQQKLALPPVGSHVAITGAWVLDAQHGHMELHPVTKIEVLK